jgi:hypothetical protein
MLGVPRIHSAPVRFSPPGVWRAAAQARPLDSATHMGSEIELLISHAVLAKTVSRSVDSAAPLARSGKSIGTLPPDVMQRFGKVGLQPLKDFRNMAFQVFESIGRRMQHQNGDGKLVGVLLEG